MRRIVSHRSYKTSRHASPSDSFHGSSFRKSQRRRGQSLMRRTELSWQKLHKHHFNQQQDTQRETTGYKQINDYLLQQEKKTMMKTDNCETNKIINIKNNKFGFISKGQFWRKAKDSRNKVEKELQSNVNNRPMSKKINEKGADPFRRILTVKSMKSLNTTDSNNKRQNFSSGESEALASFYQMNEILEHAHQNKYNQKSKNRKTPEESTSQEYQLFGNKKNIIQQPDLKTLHSNSNKNSQLFKNSKNSNYFTFGREATQTKNPYQVLRKSSSRNDGERTSSRAKGNKVNELNPTKFHKCNLPDKSQNEQTIKHNCFQTISKRMKPISSRSKNGKNHKKNEQEKSQASNTQKQDCKRLQQKLGIRNYQKISKISENKQKNGQFSPTQADQSVVSNKKLFDKKINNTIIKRSLATDLPLFSRNSSFLNQSLINSKQNQTNSSNIIAQIQVHLQVISELAEYCKGMIQLYENLDQWEELIFLMYKKYFLQRQKVMKILKSITDTNNSTNNTQLSFIKNPFVLSICTISLRELTEISAKENNQLIKMIQQIESQNMLIRDSMRNFYNIIIDKSGQRHINMDSKEDNFSELIFKDMSIEINLLEEMMYKGNPGIRNRLKQVYKVGFLISELNNKLIMGYDESLEEDDDQKQQKYLEKAKILFKKYCSAASQ